MSEYPSGEINQKTHDYSTRGIMQEQNTEQVKYVLNSDDVEQQIEIYLRGLKYDRAQGRYLKDESHQPLLNDAGVSYVLNFMKPYLSRIYSLSDFEPEEITGMTKMVAEQLSLGLLANKRSFRMTSTNVEIITLWVTNAVFSTLKKARHGNMRTFLKDTSKYVETRKLEADKGFIKSMSPFSN